MKTYILVILISLVVLFLIRSVIRNRKKSESKLSILEHPGTFKKPDIEMVSTSFEKKELPDQIVELKITDQKEEK